MSSAFIAIPSRIYSACISDFSKKCLAALFLILCTQIKVFVPGTPVPITGQTLGVLLLGVFCKRSIAVQGAMLYLFLGVIGIPVFAGKSAGLSYFSGVTAGYLLAYPLEAFLASWCFSKKKGLLFWMLCLVPCITQLLLGSLWLGFFVGWQKILLLGFFPFFLLEAAKSFIVRGILIMSSLRNRK